jgi:hypothetical protein
VFLKSASTGLFCKISGSSVTRQSLICDQTTSATATALTYTLQGARSGAGCSAEFS